MTPLERSFREHIAAEGFELDPAQLAALPELQRLQNELESRPSFWQRWSRPKPPKGVYLWGGVGRGKTFLMDFWFARLDVRQKRRLHFHRFMSQVHAQLKELKSTTDPLERVARRIASDTRVLCFDEFFVSDIADAMILGNLLSGLFQRDVALVATSNSKPDDLYRDGLQRSRFLPAIDNIKKHTNVVHFAGGTDYRLRFLSQADVYQVDQRGRTNRLEEYFIAIADSPPQEAKELEILGRMLGVERLADGIAWFTFAELCEGPRSQEDYIELARLFHSVILSDVPILNRDNEDGARRFIALVDEFYDRRVKLIICAAAAINELYQGTRLAFEFERTTSRLAEMQTHDYLAQPHRP